MLIPTLLQREEEVRIHWAWLDSGLITAKREISGLGCLFLCVGLRTCNFSGESLHGYRICIQAILQDKPKIATMNLGKVSSEWWSGTRRLGLRRLGRSYTVGPNQVEDPARPVIGDTVSTYCVSTLYTSTYMRQVLLLFSIIDEKLEPQSSITFLESVN